MAAELAENVRHRQTDGGVNANRGRDRQTDGRVNANRGRDRQTDGRAFMAVTWTAELSMEETFRAALLIVAAF